MAKPIRNLGYCKKDKIEPKTSEVEEEEANEIPEYGEDEEEEVYVKFKLFESYPRYGMLKNLIFDDDTRAFGDIEPGKASFSLVTILILAGRNCGISCGFEFDAAGNPY